MRYCVDIVKDRLVVTVGREDREGTAVSRINLLADYVSNEVEKLRVYDQVRMKEVYVLRRDVKSESSIGQRWRVVQPNSLASMGG